MVDRISVIPGAPGYDPVAAHWTRVILDGVEVKYAIAACVSEGWVERYKRGPDNGFIDNADRTGVEVERVMGVVELRRDRLMLDVYRGNVISEIERRTARLTALREELGKIDEAVAADLV